MRALKRLTIETLRQGALAGRKVLYIWDRAGIDFIQWDKWKRGSGIYFISRVKENMVLIPMGNQAFDRDNAVNIGVISDEYVATSSAGVLVRRVTYKDPDTQRIFEFITTEMSIEPGLIAQLYRMRWDIEKVFDEIKNKLHEKKAWATTATAKSMQAQFICLTHNLITLLEARMMHDESLRVDLPVGRKYSCRF
ncbi:MAG: transposase [Verrucomicrobiales bacterium]